MLTRLTRTGSRPAQQVRRARILLELDEHDPDRGGPVSTSVVIAARVGVCTKTSKTSARVAKAYLDHDGEVLATIPARSGRVRRCRRPSPGEIEAQPRGLPAPSRPAMGHRRDRAGQLLAHRGFKTLSVCTERRTRVVEALIALAKAPII